MTICDPRLVPNEAAYFKDIAARIARDYPAQRPEPGSDSVFEIGLCLAGAVSAGAYTAGVVDFLLEALSEWEAARADANDPVLRHRAVISSIAGTSAGGVNSAILACTVPYQLPRNRYDQGPAGETGNPFYESWVRSVDFRQLFGTNDIAAKTDKLYSLLDCSVLDNTVHKALTFSGAPATTAPAYLADPLRLILSVGNLRGVPYRISLSGTGGTLGHPMQMHKDYMRFALTVPGGTQIGAAPEPARPDEIALAPADSANRAPKDWSLFGETALATAAFPLALAPREIYRCANHYDFSRVAVSDDDGRGKVVPLRPTLPAAIPGAEDGNPGHYRFVCVDGGTFDNEPLEELRIALAGPLGRNPRGLDVARRGTILIDPFAEPPGMGPYDRTRMAGNPEKPGDEPVKDRDRLLRLAAAILGAYKENARSKPAELALAEDEDVRSRYLILPARQGIAGSRAIASGALGGFLGFMSPDYRHHDFMLGRRNCQHFLRRHFTLGTAHKLFAASGAAIVDHWLTRTAEVIDDATGQVVAKPNYYRELGELPVIPLVGTAARPLPLPAWPRGKGDADALKDLLEARIAAILERVIDFTILGRWIDWAVRPLIRNGLKSKILDLAITTLRKGVADIDAAFK